MPVTAGITGERGNEVPTLAGRIGALHFATIGRGVQGRTEMSLRGAFAATTWAPPAITLALAGSARVIPEAERSGRAGKQSPRTGDCFSKTRNDMWAKINALQEVQSPKGMLSASGEELSTTAPGAPGTDRTLQDLRPATVSKVS